MILTKKTLAVVIGVTAVGGGGFGLYKFLNKSASEQENADAFITKENMVSKLKKSKTFNKYIKPESQIKEDKVEAFTSLWSSQEGKLFA